MDREQAKDTVKSYLPDWLESHGCSTRKPFLCLNPDHNDRNPSMSYDRRRNKVHCFSCGADYDLLDLIGIEYGLRDPKEIFEKAYSLYGLEIDTRKRSTAAEDFGGRNQNKPGNERDTHTHMDIHTTEREDFLAYFKERHQHLVETDYMKERGIPQEILDRFLIGYEPSFTKGTGGQTWKAIIIPTSRSTYTARNTDPKADKKARVRKVGPNILFNSRRLQEATTPIIITEGEIDALSIITVGGEAVGLGSTANWRSLVKVVEAQRPVQPLILGLDNDQDGQKATEELVKELERLQISFYRLNLYGEAKDANEALCKDRDALTAAVESVTHLEEEALEAEREEYLKSNTAAHLQDFLDGIAESVNTPFIPTGFTSLDNALDGGLYEGLYILGAITSLGKTTLALQIADNIAASGHDVLIFSLEMARSELMSKSISRHTLLEALQIYGSSSNAKTARGITTGSRYAKYSKDERAVIQKAVEAYGSYAEHLFIFEGIGNIGVEEIRETVRKHISFTGHTPVVLIDYVQILSPADIRATDKQNTDKAVLELKRISRDFKTPVIGISSFNRANYKEAVTMEAFKESGSLEYGSDVLLGLQLKGAGKKDFDPTKAKTKDPRELELVVLKNRNGKTGDRIEMEYHPLFNYFTEP